ncbi:MAG: M23 family metallopeptidase [Dorea sp.]|jgi:murein DD-endopeptidase MepM/ murein hydrolase activator NlpD|nr:M23 family metallopeptidase [Dorea sp.]
MYHRFRGKMYINSGKLFVLLLLLALFTVLGTEKLKSFGVHNTEKARKVSDEDFRNGFFSDEMWEREEELSPQCRQYLSQVKNEAVYFPVPESTLNSSLKTSYADSWMKERTYGGQRGHEGTDIMAAKNQRGLYPVVSITDGVISNLGWLDRGGYRIGITTGDGTYYYYAHLDSYANIKEGSPVKAGELLGYMGDSGYGSEGTTGNFDVHLHLGIYFYRDGEEISVNPYYLLKFLENNKLKYAYS